MARLPNPKFVKWALSYQGMDGGNPESELWFCGIEYGGTDNASAVEFSNDNEGDWVKWRELKGKRLPYFVPQKNGAINETLKVDGPFAISQAKIASSYYGERIDTWKQLAGDSGKCFKMNLYPMAFKSYDDNLWTQDHFLRTGFVSKSEYKSWNLNNRFPLLRQLVNEFDPKVLVCFGQTLKTEFLTAFCDNDEQIFEEITLVEIGDISNKSNRKLFHRRINSGKTLLLICPFPTGAYGLNSDNLLKQVADKIKGLC